MTEADRRVDRPGDTRCQASSPVTRRVARRVYCARIMSQTETPRADAVLTANRQSEQCAASASVSQNESTGHGQGYALTIQMPDGAAATNSAVPHRPGLALNGLPKRGGRPRAVAPLWQLRPGLRAPHTHCPRTAAPANGRSAERRLCAPAAFSRADTVQTTDDVLLNGSLLSPDTIAEEAGTGKLPS